MQNSCYTDDVENGRSSENAMAIELRGWRFPLSRYHLWDRQIIADRLAITPTSFLPDSFVSSTVFNGILLSQEEDQNAGDALFLDAEWNVEINGRCRVKVECTKTPRSKPTCSVPCVGKRHEEDTSSAQKRVVEQLKHRLDSSCIDLESCPELSALFPIQFVHSAHRVKETTLEGYLLTPDSSFHFTPIRMKSICNVPLADVLRATLRTEKHTDPQVGYLSMDRCRRLLPLAANDPLVVEMTLVGVWITGLNEVLHPVVLATCYRFQQSAALKDKATSGGAFLLLFYGRGDYSAKLYECQIDNGANISTKFALFKCRLLSGKSGRSGYLKVKWTLEPLELSETRDSNHHSVHSSVSSQHLKNSSDSSLAKAEEPTVEEKTNDLSSGRLLEVSDQFLNSVPFSFQTGDTPQRKRTRSDTAVHEISQRKPVYSVSPINQNNSASLDQTHTLDKVLQTDALPKLCVEENSEDQTYQQCLRSFKVDDPSSPGGGFDSGVELYQNESESISLSVKELIQHTPSPDEQSEFCGFSVESSPIKCGSESSPASLLPNNAPGRETTTSLTTKIIDGGPESSLSSTEMAVQPYEYHGTCANPSCVRLEEEVNTLNQRVLQMEGKLKELFSLKGISLLPTTNKERNEEPVTESCISDLAVVPVETVKLESGSLQDCSVSVTEPMEISLGHDPVCTYSPQIPLGFPSLRLYSSSDLSIPGMEEYDEQLETLSRKYLT